MKTSLLLAQGASIASVAAIAIAEPHQTNAAALGAVTATPTLNDAARRWKPDPTECETENFTPLFNPPTPTGDLDKALNSYLISAGSSHCSQTLIGVTLCEVLSPSAWCQFTSEAPSGVLDAYTTHASKLSAWSSKYSSGLAALPTKCPLSWDNWHFELQEGKGLAFQQEGIAIADCYAKSKETSKEGDDGKDKGSAGGDKTGGESASYKDGKDKDGNDGKDDKGSNAASESSKIGALLIGLVSCGVVLFYL